MVGLMFGSSLTGYISDHYGRRWVRLIRKNGYLMLLLKICDIQKDFLLQICISKEWLFDFKIIELSIL